MAKRIVIWAALIGMVLVVLAIVLLWDALPEHYYIHQLRSSEARNRDIALERLVALTSVKAVPAILAMKVESGDLAYDPILKIALEKKTEVVRVFERVSAHRTAAPAVRCYAMYLLSEIGWDAALPVAALEVAANDDDALIREFAEIARKEMERKQSERGKRGRLGMMVEKSDALVIVETDTVSPAGRVDFKKGDVIERVEGVEPRDLGDLADIVTDKRVGDVVAFAIRRGSEQLERHVIFDTSGSSWGKVLPKILPGTSSPGR